MARIVALLLAGICFASIPDRVRAQAPAPTLQWEVANRFRLFRDEAQFRSMAEAYAGRRAGAGADASGLEVELELRAAEKRLGPAFGDRSSIAQYGWASAIVSDTCFQNGNRGHFPCRLPTGDQFLEPRHADVLVRLGGLPSAATRTCTVTVTDRGPVTGPCDKDVRVAGLEFDKPFSILVQEHGTELARLDGQSARSVVVVGFGDSFASGEGNPDRPAVLGDDFSSYDRSSLLPGEPAFGGKVRQYPVRPDSSGTSLGPASAAVWLNAQCHRSLYSHQLKAALQLAIEEQHLAVTYLGYGCTGAEVPGGLLGFWKARDDVPRRYYDAAPQLMRFLRDACANPAPYQLFRSPNGPFDWRSGIKPCATRRLPKVDALLLSIGGNDVGFSSVIANEVVDSGGGFSGFRRLLYRLWLKEASPIPFAEAERRARSDLAGRYTDLATAMNKLVGIEPRAIIQTAYPNVTLLTDGHTCGTTTDGMDVHEILGLRKASTGPDTARFVGTLNGIIKQDIANLGAGAWTVVDDHVARFAGHALCSGGAPAGTPQAAMSGDMRFPAWDFDRSRWQRFRPSNWAAYLPRNRWLVTPNDAFLTGNTMDITSGTSNPRDKVQPLYAATLSGSFHPNALGQAAIADAVLPQLRRVLGL